MMSIDEAIKDLLYDAQCNRADLDIDWAERNEQLAEWLEELKKYRKHIELTEIPEQYKLGFQDGIVNIFENGYNKAIDDFEKSLKDYFVIPHDVRVIEMKAEQLKVGRENEKTK